MLDNLIFSSSVGTTSITSDGWHSNFAQALRLLKEAGKVAESFFASYAGMATTGINEEEILNYGGVDYASVPEGARIQWYFAEESSMNAVKSLFESEGIEDIELIYEPIK